MNMSRFRLCAAFVVLLFLLLVISAILMQLNTRSIDAHSHVDEETIRQYDFYSSAPEAKECYDDGKICKGLE
jgi:hypothetical protein